MSILDAALAALLLTSSSTQASSSIQETPPREERLEAYRKELESALAPESELKTARRTVMSARDHVDPRVIAVLDARGLRHANLELRDFAVETMGHVPHPDALAALHAMLERDAEELAAAPARHALLLKAIARNGNDASVALLAAKPFASPERGVLAARLLGLGNIRTPAALAAVLELLRSAPPERVTEAATEFRTAVFVLAGEDPGPETDAWPAWLEARKDTLALAAEIPAELPTDLRRCWHLFWGPPREGKKSTLQRGKEPEGGRRKK